MVETLIGLSLICIGCVILFVGVSLFRKSLRLIRKGIRTDGRVVGIHHNGPEADPELEVVFTDQSGIERQCQLRCDRNRQSIGDLISLIYEKDDPKNVLGTTYDQLWWLPICLLWISGIVVFLGVMTMLTRWR